MLRPTVKAAEFEKYGFKRCKGIYKDCFYLCVARGSKMLFVSDVCFDVFEWDAVDPRIHKNANHNKDKRDWMDIIYDLIKANLLESEFKSFAGLKE